MENIYKNIIKLYILHKDTILMRKFPHQDYEVIDTFAFKDTGDIETGISDIMTRLFGKTYPYYYCGSIESVINKKGITAHITSKEYKIILDEKPAVLENYTDDVTTSGSNTFWLHKDEIKNETRLREGDKKVFEGIFEERNRNIKMIEDQGDRWIDAKCTLYEDS